MRVFTVAAFALAIALTLGTYVIAQHGTEDKVLFGGQLAERTGDHQTDGIKTFLLAKEKIETVVAY